LIVSIVICLTLSENASPLMLAHTALFGGEFLERGAVVPAGGARLGVAAGALEEHAERVRARAEGGRDPAARP
jgi:hypothetical protein